VKISLSINSSQAQAQLRRWGGEFRKSVRVAVSKGLRAAVPEVQAQVRRHVASRLNIKRSAFLKSFKASVYDRDPTRLPALLVRSGIPWAGIHESGGVVSPSKAKGLLIPLHGRIGKKKFKTMVAELMRGGNAFFVKNKRGQVILMAENIKEHDRVISGPKRRFKKATGVGRLKRGADVPIAVLVPRVKLRSRLDVKSATLAAMPQLAVAVQRAVEALK
jgi:Family of unknown function (DUF6441)